MRHQLDWVKENGFGGVEVAWLYPLYYFNKQLPKDTASGYQPWLTPQWSEMVAFTKQYCDSIGLGCDFTFGTGWPFGDSEVPVQQTAKVYGDSLFRQWIRFGWEYPTYGLVVDHLSKAAIDNYGNRMGKALAAALEGSPSGLFCDSWEIKLNAKYKLWTPGFAESFIQQFGYDIVPYMKDSLDNFPHVRYDYMMHLSETVIDSFYKPYHELCNRFGAFDRVQCLASPTDVMTAYAVPDVPETEAMLNNPDYSRIVSSAACLAGKREITCETFTCMYGFPNIFIRQEQTADLKLLADALFANGVNHIFWHGLPYNPIGSDSISFFASVHAGPGGSLKDELPAFNNYMAKVSGYMKKGRTYSDVAVYIPFEDGVMAGPYPKERQRVWVWGQYEMRYIHYPEEVEGHHPLWINRHFLDNAEIDNGRLVCGDASFSSLYIDVEWMDARTLHRISELAQTGFPICMKQMPKQPGKNKSAGYEKTLEALAALPNVTTGFKPVGKPLVAGDSIPDYWCRKDGDDLYIFFAHPFCIDLLYPITFGQSFTGKKILRTVTINANGKSRQVKLIFNPYQSLLIKVDADGNLAFEDISFVPKDPLVKPKGDIKMHF